MSDGQTRIGLWLPDDWGHLPDDRTRELADSDIDLLLVPENHDEWANKPRWESFADDAKTAIYAGFLDDEGWRYGHLYDPVTGQCHTYTKHSTADRLAFERADWNPEALLEPVDFRGTALGTTVCHDHYLSPLMGLQGAAGADALVNLSASPVKRRKWGEILQSRAIENGAYAFCTMHGLREDGTRPHSNRGHAFAFDPYGDPIQMTQLSTNEVHSPFETEPDSIYTASVDPTKASDAKRTLHNPDSRPSRIERVRNNEAGDLAETDTRLSISRSNNGLEISHAGVTRELSPTDDEVLSVGEYDLHVVSVELGEILGPETLYLRLSDIESERTPLILVNAPQLTDEYLRSVVAPVLRARSVEWCSPVVLATPQRLLAYHIANTAKDTHRISGESLQIEMSRAWGLDSALKPVDGEFDALHKVAELVENRRD